MTLVAFFVMHVQVRIFFVCILLDIFAPKSPNCHHSVAEFLNRLLHVSYLQILLFIGLQHT